MKLVKYILGLTIIATYGLTSCEDKCWGAECAETITFKLFDKTTGQDLVSGVNPTFYWDSIQLKSQADFEFGTNHLLGDVYENSRLLNIFTKRAAADTSYLRLSYTDIDTLIISYTYQRQECCGTVGGFGKINMIKYNGQTAQKTGTYFTFEK